MADSLQGAIDHVATMVDQNTQEMMAIVDAQEWVENFMGQLAMLAEQSGSYTEDLEKYQDVNNDMTVLIGLIANVGVEAENLQQKMEALQ